MLRRRTIIPRFRLPMDKQQTKDALMAAIMAEVEFRHRTFIPNDKLTAQIEKMAEWLTKEHRKFGILLCGKCGNGKSTMVKALQQLLNILGIRNEYTNRYYGMQIISAKEINALVSKDYANLARLARTDMLAIDDLGTEPLEVLNYGNVMSPIIDLLTQRYEEQLFTIITTNLTPDMIRKVYGERIADRLCEMTEIVVFDNDSCRRNNTI